MDVINDSLRAVYLINEDYDNAQKIKSKLKRGYFSTNERLGYIKKIDITGERVLTVCGSGDQIFICIINGAKEVDTFDCNPLQYYVMEIKKSAIMGLEKEEYLKFFPLRGGNINEMYNVKYYERFKQYLDTEARMFWDYVYASGNNKIYLLELFSNPIAFESDYTKSYYLLKDALFNTRINFYLNDIYHVSKSLNKETYKLIMLSNIFDHLYRDSEYDEEAYLKFVKENFYPLLKESGICVYHHQLLSMQVQSFKNYPSLENGGEPVKILTRYK